LLFDLGGTNVAVGFLPRALFLHPLSDQLSLETPNRVPPIVGLERASGSCR
jgi:hypothetical protein